MNDNYTVCLEDRTLFPIMKSKFFIKWRCYVKKEKYIFCVKDVENNYHKVKFLVSSEFASFTQRTNDLENFI